MVSVERFHPEPEVTQEEKVKAVDELIAHAKTARMHLGMGILVRNLPEGYQKIAIDHARYTASLVSLLELCRATMGSGPNA